MFSNFTKKYFNYFVKKKYNLNNNNSLVLLLNNEKENINNFLINSKIKINYDYNNNNLYEKKIFEYTNSYFVDTLNVIKKLKDLDKIIIIKWNTNTIILKTNEKKINLLLLKINLIIHIIEYIENNLSDNKFNNLLIILVLTDLEKYEPNLNDIIDIKHINSGLTEHSHINKTIFIWRYEEFEKVLFHEIIHVLNIEKRNEENIQIIESKFHNYFEAITDFYAIIYHIIYLSLITNIKPQIYLEIELAFIKNQAMKMNNIFELNEWVGKPSLKINQNSNGFSYYILKYLLFEYILKLDENNLLNYLKKINLNILLKNIIKIKFKIYNYYNIKSLRMTLFQIKY